MTLFSRRMALAAFLVAAAVLSWTAAVRADEKEESWQAIYIGKQRVGFAHVSVEDIVRGGKKISVCDNLNQMTIVRFGFALRMSVVQTTEEDDEGNMLSFKYSVDNPPT